MDIREIIDRIYRMPESSAVRLAACMSSLSRPRGYCVLEAGRVEPNLFFIGRGIARACISADGKKVTFWIGAEGSALVSLKSYVDDEPGYETVELMEDSLLYVLKRSDLERFSRRGYPHRQLGAAVRRIGVPAYGAEIDSDAFPSGCPALRDAAEGTPRTVAAGTIGDARLLSGDYAGEFEPDPGTDEVEIAGRLPLRPLFCSPDAGCEPALRNFFA